ncbi:MutS-related protein [Lacticaseibacillus parakribbianus]|uniref:MutS-related protein n=1 Tax=Lacticaseibacillus parakribbianus TaxID=2970927 RepID=UPI0021CB34BA|nr:DNA mismatch repair protein MutS [Lacticaseibacillus parakribbianus]
MDANSGWWLVGFGLVLVAVVVVSSIRERLALRDRLLGSWGQLPEVRRQDSPASLEEAFQYASQLHPADSTVDALTWQDLNMQAVFRSLNLTESSVGAEALYARLHAFDFGHAGDLEDLIGFFTTEPVARLRCRTAFARLGKSDHNQTQAYLLEGAKHELHQTWRYVVLGCLPLVGLALAFALPLLGVTLVMASLIFNLIYYQLRRERLTVELNAMRYLVQTVATARRVAKLKTPRQAALQQALAPLATITRTAFVFRIKTGTAGEVIADYLSIAFMLPFISYNFVLEKLHRFREAALALWRQLGDLECAIAIANYRLAQPVSCIPRFEEGGVSATGLVHPLLKKPVANDLAWARTALITGSNASGKSTYVKSVAINCLLAQTINTATAETFTLAPGHVITAMAIQDDLSAGDSYFIAEIKAIRRLLTQVQKGARTYGFVDEILKGTNTVERIAASASIIDWLEPTAALTMVATHDSELTAILGAGVVNWHFQESVDAGGVHFDYRLHQGPATTHNAIALLAHLQYPAAVTATAKQLAAEFEATHRWPAVAPPAPNA